ncbi:NfeD family protein [Pelagicoccus sp. SDUM812003]|uniref:NfeD family protein n=1 Tax=Pelagicoccus sp. SDUM812003 TaxID=3041267 RepID=UPI00280F0282|nr:NfeD family protein [Pelagicoccus sp. SDUM812003]MDQ8204810.1 NfeD family protein [Pelagicoccus sp. SDUM812003]
MSVIVGLLVLGFALIMLEIFIPGGIVGLFGGASLLFGIWLAYREFGVDGALIAFLVSVVGVVLCLFVEYKILPKTKVGKRLFLEDRVSGRSQPDVGQSELIGATGRAVTALAPSGQIVVDGRKLEACSRSGFLNKGQKVRIDSVDQFKVTVSKI